MMNKFCAIFGLCAALTGPTLVQGADPGTTSGDFLKLGIGPRAIAMGNAQVGLADDVFATYWNPGGLGQLKTQEVGFVHTQYLQNITTEYLAYAYPHETLGTFAGSFTFLNVGQFQGYDAVGIPTSNIGANDISLGLSYAKPIWHDNRTGSLLSVGATGKYIQEHLDTVSARAEALDAGILFVPGLRWGDVWDGWKAGVSMRNFGTSLKFDQQSFTLPRSLTAGVSWSGLFYGENITLAADGQQPNDGPRTIGIGAEVTTLEVLILRAGYTSEGDLGDGIRAGAGLRLKTFEFDYAFSSGGDFGAIHRIGVTMHFGKKVDDPQKKAEVLYLRGAKEYNENRLTDALVDFNKALELDPTHPKALEMMHKTYDRLKATTPE